MPDTLSTLSAEAAKYYDRLLVDRLLPVCNLASLGQQRTLPKRNGSTVSYRKFASLATATTALTEGTTPTGTSLSVTEVTGTVYQYGNFVTLSDALDLLGIDPVVTEAIDVLGENAGESNEEIIRATVAAGTNVRYGTGSARSSQTASSPITLTLVRKAVRDLVAAKAKPFYGTRDEKTGQGGLYVGYIHPYAWYDLTGDTTVLNTFVYSDPSKLYTLELPTLAGVAWIVSSKAPLWAGAGASSADVYGTLIMGKDAFGVSTVGGVSGGQQFESVVHPLGSSGAADPLNQRSSVGWKAYQCVKILNEGALQRIEAGVTA